MKTTGIIITLAACCGLALAAVHADAGAGVPRKQRIRIKMTPRAPGSGVRSACHLIVEDGRDGLPEESMWINARGPELPENGHYRVFLVDREGREFGLGDLHPNARSGTHFNVIRWDPGGWGLPHFSGGQVQVRLGDEVVTAGRLPQIRRRPRLRISRGGARVRNREILRPVEPWPTFSGGPLGQITVRYSRTRGGAVRERIRVRIVAMSGRYTVVATDGESEFVLGEIDNGYDDRGVEVHKGWLDLDTRRGDVIPNGGVRNLDGFDIEVRNSGAVIVGPFPDVDLSDD